MPAEAFYTLIITVCIFSVPPICIWLDVAKNKPKGAVWYVIATYVATLVFLFWNIGPAVESKVSHEIKLSNAGYPYYEHDGGICIIDPKKNVKEGDLAVFTTRYRTTKIGLNFEAKTTLEVMSPEDTN